MIPARYNYVYTRRDIVKSLTYLSLEAEYAEGGLDMFRRRLNRHYKLEMVPNADTFLYRLKKLSRKEALATLHKLNGEVLSMARRKGAFRRKAVAAIDLTCIPYYGRPNRYVVQGRYKLGTNWFHCYAALRLVEGGRRYVIKSRLVTPLELCEKAGIVEELVTEAKRQGVRIRLLLLDKGFYSHEVIETLKALGVKFLVAVPRNNRVKQVILDYFRTGKGQVRRFSLKKGRDIVDFNLTIHRLRRNRKGLRNVLELYGAFATNLGFKKTVRARLTLPQDYRRRWGIETGFMVDG